MLNSEIYGRAVYRNFAKGALRPEAIMLFFKPIMLLSNSQKVYLLAMLKIMLKTFLMNEYYESVCMCNSSSTLVVLQH